MNGLHIAALICTTTSCIALMVALGTRHWVDLGQNYSGLWAVCFATTIGTSCTMYGRDISDHIHATRAFLCFAIITSGTAIFILGTAFFRSQFHSYSLVKIAPITNFLAGMFALIALSAFTGAELPNGYFGWSFGLGWACVPLCIISGVLAFKIPLDAVATA